MKQGIPKSVQDLLARQTPGDEHPSADLLNGYAEQSLTANEMAKVMTHLAACKDCREIVFLATAVTEEEAVPAVAAALPAQRQQVVAPAGRAKSGWMWWKWAAPAVAVVVVAAGVIVERDQILQRSHPSEAVSLQQAAPSAPASNQTLAESYNPNAAPPPTAAPATPAQTKKYDSSTERARQDHRVEQAQDAQQQLAHQKAMESAQLSSSLEKPRPNAVAGAAAPMPAAARANPAPSLVSGDFTGTVTDPSGAIVPNATVTLRNNSTGQKRSTTSNNSGAYRFSLLQPGSYTVSATASGFGQAETTATINVGQATVADVKLAVGSSSQAVEVTSAAPLIQTMNGDRSTNFDQNEVRNAPNGGNDLTSTQKTAPGPSSSVGGKDQTQSAASLKSGLMSSGQPNAAANRLAKAVIPTVHWRISADGHVERALPGSAWTRILADQPVAFRVVATIGSNVWAGGNGGALFHSADQGESWSKVALSVNGKPERSAVVSIHFDNTVEGSVSTDSGATWITSDGGQTWIKR